MLECPLLSPPETRDKTHMETVPVKREAPMFVI